MTEEFPPLDKGKESGTLRVEKSSCSLGPRKDFLSSLRCLNLSFRRLMRLVENLFWISSSGLRSIITLYETFLREVNSSIRFLWVVRGESSIKVVSSSKRSLLDGREARDLNTDFVSLLKPPA